LWEEIPSGIGPRGKTFEFGDLCEIKNYLKEVKQVPDEIDYLQKKLKVEN
jgi:hypothetical protein